MTIDYHSDKDKSHAQAIRYSKTHESIHRYLAYRDIPSIIRKYFPKGKALDYGCGTGYSTQFLKDLGFDVCGVDISKQMLHQAQIKYPNLCFALIENGIIPFKAFTFDLVFSSFVLLEIGTQNDIIDYLKEAKRVMKKNGLFIAITASQDLHSISKKWLNFRTDFPENNPLTSGKLVKLYLYDSDIEFTDYYWTEADYRSFFAEVGFNLIDVYYPLGNKNDIYPWKDELSSSPFVVLIAKNP